MVSEGTVVTLVGIASGVGTTIGNILISRKIKGRAEIGVREVLMAMGAVFGGSLLAAAIIQGRAAGEAPVEEPIMVEDILI